MSTVRAACLATSRSWVIRTTVRPCSCSSAKRERTSSVDAVSKLPVGSSARMRSGSVTSARATDTRCCCPPESSFGRWSRRSPRPTRSSAAIARRRRSARGTRAYTRGSSTLRWAVSEGEQVELLEHEPDPSVPDVGEVLLVHDADVDAGQAVRAGGRDVEAAEDVHQRRLARSRRAHDRDVVALGDDEVDAAQRLHLDRAGGVGLAHLGQVEDRLRFAALVRAGVGRLRRREVVEGGRGHQLPAGPAGA